MTTTALVDPVGTMLEDGFVTRIAIAADTNIALWVKTLKPFGIDAGDPIDETTMHNTALRTAALRQLLTLTQVSFNAAYDPAVISQLIAIAGVNGWITIHEPDGSTLDFVGGFRSAEPSEHQEGQQPTMNVIFVPTNQLNGVETMPVYTAPGTGT